MPLQPGDEDGPSKRKRTKHACDVCRKRKVRCDGKQAESESCTNCVVHGFSCTFHGSEKRKPLPRSYFLALEDRMKRATDLIATLAPTLDIDSAIGPMPIPLNEEYDEDEDSKREDGLMIPKNPLTGHEVALASSEESSETGEEDTAFIRTMMDRMNISVAQDETIVGMFQGSGREETLHLRPEGIQQVKGGFLEQSTEEEDSILFYGKSANLHVISPITKLIGDCSDPSAGQNVSTDSPGSSTNSAPSVTANNLDIASIEFAWPSAHLEKILVDVFFSNTNLDFPIINEVIFRRQLQKVDWKLHDRPMIVVALGVFSLATYYLSEEQTRNIDHVAEQGAYWYSCLRDLLDRNFIATSPSIPFLQAQLCVILCASAIQEPSHSKGWVPLGLVIRLLQDMGAHRKLTARRLRFSLIKEETYRRLWWVAYLLDRSLSTDLGRPLATQDEDFDLDEILLVDDAYIVAASETKTVPIQPPGQPSRYEGFAQSIKVSTIMGKALRTIFAITRSRTQQDPPKKSWHSHQLRHFKDLLQEWLQQIPSNLLVNPATFNTMQLVQNSRLFVSFYITQLVIHRPFVQERKKSELAFEAIISLLTAARSGIRILSSLHKRNLLYSYGPHAPVSLFTFGAHLLLVLIGAQQRGFRFPDLMLDDLHASLVALQSLRTRWKIASPLSKQLGLAIERSRIMHSSTNLGEKRSRNTTDAQTLPPAPQTLPSVPHPVQTIPATQYMSSDSTFSELFATFPPVKDTPSFGTMAAPVPWFSTVSASAYGSGGERALLGMETEAPSSMSASEAIPRFKVHYPTIGEHSTAANAQGTNASFNPADLQYTGSVDPLAEASGHDSLDALAQLLSAWDDRDLSQLLSPSVNL